MIDLSLVLSLFIVIVGTLIVLRVVPPVGFDRQRISEAASTPLLVGFVASRAVFLLFDDPGSLTRFRDIMVFRSGLEFWAGLVVAVSFCVWQNRRAPEGPLNLLAAGVPYLLVGLAFYEGACLLRDGCLGPTSSAGITPYGLTQPMIPVGLVVALAFMVSAWLLRRNQTMSSFAKLSVALAVVGGVRALASWYLPAIGSSRVGMESIVAFLVGMLAWAISLQTSKQSSAAIPVLNRAEDQPSGDGETFIKRAADFQKLIK